MANIFTDTIKGICGNRPPVWYMRQAGRVLSDYNKLRENHSFNDIMSSPELASKVTLMPISSLGVDAAIIFSDILSIPMAMGLELDWTGKGPHFIHPLCESPQSYSRLRLNPEELCHVYHALDLATGKGVAPVIGFCGAPLTTLCYMIQGTSLKHDFPEAKKFFYLYRKETKIIIDIVTEAIIYHAKKQAEHGISAFQLFDTHAGIVPLHLYKELFVPAVKRIATEVRSAGIPFIYFPKGIGMGLSLATPDLCDFVSIDWQTPLSLARETVHKEVGLQGNIDPTLLFASKEEIEGTMKRIYVPFFRENKKWIVNLGHGVSPDTPEENLIFLTDWIKNSNNWK